MSQQLKQFIKSRKEVRENLPEKEKEGSRRKHFRRQRSASPRYAAPVTLNRHLASIVFSPFQKTLGFSAYYLKIYHQRHTKK